MIDPSVLREGGVLLARSGAVVTVTLNRPNRRNAQTPQMWSALADIGRDLPGDVRVVVLRGAGPDFSSGLDTALFAGDEESALARLAASPEGEALDQIAAYQRAFSWWSRTDIVSVAVVQGHAIGAGFQLALACDVRIAADDVRLSLPEASRGLVPDLGGTRPLVAAVGYSRALEICLTGRAVAASEAVRLGLVNLVVPRAELDAAVADFVSAVLAVPRATATELKALLQRALGQTAQQQLATEREAQLRRLKDGAGDGD